MIAGPGGGWGAGLGPQAPSPLLDSLVCVTVHTTGVMPPDVNVVSPVARVSLLDAKTGRPLPTPGGKPHLALQTRPFSLKQRTRPELALEWEQRLPVEELDSANVVKDDVLMLVELLQFPPSFAKLESDRDRRKVFRNGPYRIAWGFLKLVGAERRPHLGRTRLQLYRYTESLVRSSLSLSDGGSTYATMSKYRVILGGFCPLCTTVFSGIM